MSSSRPSGSRKIWWLLALGEAHDLVLDRRAVARADALDLRRNTSARDARLARMIACVAGVVRVMWQAICGVVIRVGQERERHRRIVAGLHLERGPSRSSAVEPRRGAGLEPAHAQARGRRAGRTGRSQGASPTRPAGILRLADMDQAAQERAGGQHHRAGARCAARRRSRRRRPGRPSTIRSSTAASIDVRGSGWRQIAACIACAVELAVGLGARAAHGRALAAVEHAELDAGRVGDPAHQRRRARRSRAPDGPCRARRWPDCRTSRRWSRSLWVSSSVRAPSARGRGRRLAAGVAAADDDDVETLLMHPYLICSASARQSASGIVSRESNSCFETRPLALLSMRRAEGPSRRVRPITCRCRTRRR